MDVGGRLYYRDAYEREFEARVVERLEHEGQRAVVLDQSYFYPTSGGQPADHGHLNETAVLDVFVREEDGAVVHVLQDELWEETVRGKIDWTRRLDHMQHHTGQHILSASFLEVADAPTVGFHLSPTSVTIDLDRAMPDAAAIGKVELRSNRIIWENRPVRVRLLSPEQAAPLELRKVPEVAGDLLRLVAIEDFDLTACGGTHVASTGAVGMIKIVGVERRSGGLRISFLCGRRALADYGEKDRVLSRLAGRFTTGYSELEKVTGALQDDLKEAQRTLRRQQEQLAQYEARMLAREALVLASPAHDRGHVRLVKELFRDRDPAALRQLANALVEERGIVALLALASPERTQLIFARSEDAPGDMSTLIRSTLKMVGGGGGGSPTFAQGGGPAAEIKVVQQALEHATKLLRAQVD
ncbi:MAG: DHHA1 domain-containing protein [Candidatus Promineifilaceae bacterium]|nr:DHHA1 domain-containing protein [Candidatus Promineifilaceae bacterium]